MMELPELQPASQTYFPPISSAYQLEWKGQTSSKFTTNRRHLEPIPQTKEVAHPLYTMYGRRHYSQSETPAYEWRPTIRTVEPVSHENDRIIGVKKIITSYTIVKPRVERVHFVEKSSSGSLSDLLSGKMFLQKNRGVKARMMEGSILKKREEDRKKRTLAYMTSQPQSSQ